MDAEIKQMFGVILGKLDSMDNRLGSLGNKVDSMDGRLGSLENKVDSMDGRLGSLENKVDSLDSKVGSLDSKVGSLDSKVGSLDSKVGSLDSKVGSLDSKVTKNSLDIEVIRNDIKTIIEVQKAHMEQNKQDHERIIKHVDEKTGLLESVLKRHSEEITNLKKKIG